MSLLSNLIVVTPLGCCEQRCGEKSDSSADHCTYNKLYHYFFLHILHSVFWRSPADSIKLFQPLFYGQRIVSVHFIKPTLFTLISIEKLIEIVFRVAPFVDTFKITLIDLIYRAPGVIDLLPIIQQLFVFQKRMHRFIEPQEKCLVFFGL